MRKSIIQTDRPQPMGAPSVEREHIPTPAPAPETINLIDFDKTPMVQGMYDGIKEFANIGKVHVFTFNGTQFGVETDERYSTVNEALSKVRPGSALIGIDYLGYDDEKNVAKFEVYELIPD